MTITESLGVGVIGLWVFAFITSFYGLIVAFSSGIITGIVALLIEPLPLIIGICNLFGYNMANDITSIISKIIG